jgi:hypothetical protein
MVVAKFRTDSKGGANTHRTRALHRNGTYVVEILALPSRRHYARTLRRHDKTPSGNA